ncbi:MAG: type II toxin-antitoxin system RelE/ParE family toxin [Steroidobacteraceae bacterium]
MKTFQENGGNVRPEAEGGPDEIWLYTARESDNAEIADRLIDSIGERFLLLAQHPHVGRARDADLRPGLRSFPVGRHIILYRVTEDGDVLILHVFPACARHRAAAVALSEHRVISAAKLRHRVLTVEELAPDQPCVGLGNRHPLAELLD